MNCPYCHHHDVPIRCPQCQRAIDGDAMEELAHIAYLRNRIDRWEQQGALIHGTAHHIVSLTEADVVRLRETIGLRRSAAPVATPPHVAPTMPVAAPQLAPRPAPALARPPFSWAQVGAYLLSERTLNTLLGLGALLILASAFVISTLNPTHLASMAHLAVMFATTLAFYSAGYVVRQRMRLLRTGATLLVIGAGLIPLDIWTLGQEQTPHWDAGAVWLVASLLCLPICVASHALLRDRPFALLTALAGSSTVLAALHHAGISLEWGLCALVLLASAYILLGRVLRARRPLLAWALAGTAQSATPLLMAGLLVAKLVPAAWHVAAPVGPSSPSDYAVGGAWWLGTAFYALCAVLLRGRRYEIAAAWVLPIAYLLTLTKMPWDASWYNLCLALLTFGYLAYAYATAYATARTPVGSLGGRLLSRPAYGVVVALTIAAALWPSATLDSRLAALAAICLAYAAATMLLRERACAYVAAYTLPVVYALALGKMGLNATAQPLAWAGLAAVLIGAAEGIAQRSGEARRPLLQTVIGWGAWTSRFAPAFFSAGYALSLVALALCGEQWWLAPRLYGIAVPPPPALVALLGVAALYGASAIARRSSVFLYSAALLAVPAYTALSALIAQRAGHALTPAMHVWLLALLGLAYLATGHGVAGRWERFARPFYLVGYGLAAVPMFLFGADRAIVAQLGALNLLVFAWSGWLVHQGRHPSYLWAVTRLFPNRTSPGFGVARTLFVYLCAWLFPVWLCVALSLWRPEPDKAVYGLVVAVLAPLYAALGRRFTRLADRSELPWYLGGYALSAIGPLLASSDATLRIVTLTIAMTLYAVSAAVSRRRAWLVPVAVLIPLLSWLGLLRLDVPLRFYGLGLLPGVAGSLVVAEVLCARLDGGVRGLTVLLRRRAWSAPFYTEVGAQGALTTAILAVVGFSAATVAADVLAAFWTALAYGALATAFAVVRPTAMARWGSLAFGAVGIEVGLRVARVPGVQQPPYWALTALLVGLVAFTIRARLQTWARALRIASAAVSVAALATALSVELGQLSHSALQSLTATLAVVGLTWVAHGVGRRQRALGYAGIALVLAGYMLQLTLFDVGQAQAFVVPAGLYLLALAYLERRRGGEAGLRTALELCGLAVLLITSVAQALGYASNGLDRLGYDVFLLFESVAIVGLGAALHWKRSLYAGSTALVADVGILLADPVRAMNTWYLMAIVGLTMIGLVVFLEQRRRQIPLWIDQWRQRMETWA